MSYFMSNLPEGDFNLVWPQHLSPESLEHVKALLALAIRQMDRNVITPEAIPWHLALETLRETEPQPEEAPA